MLADAILNAKPKLITNAEPATAAPAAAAASLFFRLGEELSQRQERRISIEVNRNIARNAVNNLGKVSEALSVSNEFARRIPKRPGLRREVSIQSRKDRLNLRLSRPSRSKRSHIRFIVTQQVAHRLAVLNRRPRVTLKLSARTSLGRSHFIINLRNILAQL